MVPNLTQVELAKSLGVSQMTISRVIHNRPGVSTKLKQRVQKMVQEADYVPNHVAAGLRNRTTKVIGLVIPDVVDSFFPEITRAVEVTARKNGYSIILTHNHESYAQDCEVISLLRGYHVCGFRVSLKINKVSCSSLHV